MSHSQNLIILTSPPASGKTYWIESLINSGVENVLIVSPLRALKDECLEKWKSKVKVVTPEEWLLKPQYEEVVIFDEFHLNFYWGDSFRPCLWEVFFGLTSIASLTIILTATLSLPMIRELEEFGRHFDEIIWLDFGNQRLKFKPERYVKCPSRLWVEDLISCGPRGKGVNLIFCPYRNDVFKWEKKLAHLGYTSWTCIGGEAKYFKEKLKHDETPDFIIATSVLSHGVNLPSISCIFFLYPLQNIDFWIQMVARGGRRGERYEVFALENPFGIKWSRWINCLAILWLSLRIQINHSLRESAQWFLKESSSARSPIKKGISS